MLVNLPMLDTAFKSELWLSAIRPAAVRDASLGFWIALNIVSLTVALAVDINRAWLDRTLVLSALDISSLFNLIVASAKLAVAHD